MNLVSCNNCGSVYDFDKLKAKNSAVHGEFSFCRCECVIFKDASEDDVIRSYEIIEEEV